jgi:hypothetical protein
MESAMNKRLATVFLLTVGGVLVPGVANAATVSTTTSTTTDPTVTVSPVFVLATPTSGPSTDPAVGTTDPGSTTSTTSTVVPVSSGKEAKPAKADKPAPPAKPAKAAPAPKPALPATASDRASVASGRSVVLVAPVPSTDQVTSADWTTDPSLFDDQGRKFG